MLAPLDEADVAEALQDFVLEGWSIGSDTGTDTRISMEPGAAKRLAELCCGDPFLFQLAGQAAWNAGSGAVITLTEVDQGWTSVSAEARLHVERVLERLPDRERSFAEAMAALDPSARTLTNIATEAGSAKASEAGPSAQRLDTVRRLISRGRLYTFRHRAVEAMLTSGWPKHSA